MPRPLADQARALTVRLHSVSSGVEPGMSTSFIGLRFARAPALTVDIHSAASGFRRRISTSGLAHCVGSPFIVTVRIHRIASALAGRISRSDPPATQSLGSHSPLKYTGLRVAAMAVVQAGTSIATRSRADLHR